MAPVYNKGQNVMGRQRGQSIFKITDLVGCSGLQCSVSIKRGRNRRDSDDRVMGGHGEQRLRSLLWMGQCIATDLSRCPWWPMQLKAPTMGMNIRTGTNTASCSIIHNVKPDWSIYLSIYFKEYISSIQMCKTLHRQADSWNTEDQDPTFQETRRSIFQSTMYSTLVLSLNDWLIDFYKIASNKEKVGGRKMNHLYFERGEGGQTRTANVNANFQIRHENILKLLQKEQ